MCGSCLVDLSDVVPSNKFLPAARQQHLLAGGCFSSSCAPLTPLTPLLTDGSPAPPSSGLSPPLRSPSSHPPAYTIRFPLLLLMHPSFPAPIPHQMARLARNSFLASFIDEGHRDCYLRAIDVAVELSAAEEEAEAAVLAATVVPVAAAMAAVDKAIHGAAVELIAASQQIDNGINGGAVATA